MTDSRSLSQNFRNIPLENTSDKTSGVNFNLGASYRAFSLTGGYIRAVDRYAPHSTSVGSETGTGAGAWSSELAYNTELLSKDTVLAVGYLKSPESLKLYFPEQRYITKASMALSAGTTLSLEYYLDKDYSWENGSVNGEGYGVTTKLGFEFQLDR